MSNKASILLYLLSFILAIFIYGKSYKINKKYRNILKWLSLSLLLLLAGMRKNLGTDYLGYINGFYLPMKTHSIFESFSKEYLFLFIVKVTVIFDNYKILFFLLNLITLYFITKALEKSFIKYKSLAFGIYVFVFYLESWNIMRQHICMAIFLYSIVFIYERNLKKFSLLILGASLIQNTVLLVYPFYFIYNFFIKNEKNKKLKKVFLIVGVTISLFGIFYYVDIISFLGEIIPFFKKYNLYIKSIPSKNKIIILKIVLLVLVWRFKERLLKNNEKNKLLLFFIVNDFLLTLLGFYNIYAKRLASYFYIYYILIIPQFLEIFPKYKIYITLIIYLISILLCILQYYIFEFAGVIPYKI